MFILQNGCLASGDSLCTRGADYSSLSTNLVLVLIKLHSVILFKAISSVVNIISPCQPLPNKGLAVPVVLSASWYHCCHQTARAHFCRCAKLNSLAVPLSCACSPSSSQKIMVFQPRRQPSQESAMVSAAERAHTLKYGSPTRAACSEGLRTSSLTAPRPSGEVSLEKMEMLGWE